MYNNWVDTQLMVSTNIGCDKCNKNVVKCYYMDSIVQQSFVLNMTTDPMPHYNVDYLKIK